SHGIVLIYLAAHPEATVRATSHAVGITERQVSRIVKDLADAGMLHVVRQGRHNVYSVDPDARLRHPTHSHVPLGRIITAVTEAPDAPDPTRSTE
ncbi:MAG TPA: helix-turn-helix domain-containing protein, partial [Thermomicrobiales bacterium]|nr:helix-turn-helix domain-containing protein [Thermomicrobiales bacterium]